MTYAPYWDEYDLETTTPEFRARWDAVAAELPDFDCKLIEKSLAEGWTLAETIEEGREINAERDECPLPFDPADHDMSMNF